MRSHNEQQLQLHRARTNLISFKKMALELLNKKKPITSQDFDVLLEASRVSPDYHDSLTLHKMVITLTVK